MKFMDQFSLYKESGERKFLTVEEREQFIQTCQSFPSKVATLCKMIAYTGCLISECLGLQYEDIDFGNRFITIHTLRKRNRVPDRLVPLPDSFLNELRLIHAPINTDPHNSPSQKLWSWSRGTGYRKVKDVMKAIPIEGYHATPIALRHSFGLYCVKKEIPLSLIKKWMGHSSYDFVCAYLIALEKSEREYAERIWE